MKKSELTKKQLQERALVVQMLAKAGWQGTGWNILFDQGKPARPHLLAPKW